MANSTKPSGSMRDKGKRLELDGKDLKLVNGAALVQQAPSFSDHFLDALVAGRWTATETGAGGGKAIFAVSATSPGGLVTGAVGATASNAEELGGTSISWKPSTLGLTKPVAFEARVKSSSVITGCNMVFGMCDNKTYGSGLNIVMSSTSTFTTSAQGDGAVFCFSTTPTSGNAFTSGGNALFAATSLSTVDTATRIPVAISPAFAASTVYTMRIEIDAAGNADFFLGVGTPGWGTVPFAVRVPLAVTPTVALTPYFAVTNVDGATSAGFSVDYCAVSGSAPA